MHSSRLWLFYFINSQIRQIPVPNQNFSSKPYYWVGWDFWKRKHQFFIVWYLVTTGWQKRKKLILPLEKYFKTLNDMITGTAGAKHFKSLTIFKVGEIRVFDASRDISRYRKLPLILILVLVVKKLL